MGYCKEEGKRFICIELFFECLNWKSDLKQHYVLILPYLPEDKTEKRPFSTLKQMYYFILIAVQFGRIMWFDAWRWCTA